MLAALCLLAHLALAAAASPAPAAVMLSLGREVHDAHVELREAVLLDDGGHGTDAEQFARAVREMRALGRISCWDSVRLLKSEAAGHPSRPARHMYDCNEAAEVWERHLVEIAGKMDADPAYESAVLAERRALREAYPGLWMHEAACRQNVRDLLARHGLDEELGLSVCEHEENLLHELSQDPVYPVGVLPPKREEAAAVAAQ